MPRRWYGGVGVLGIAGTLLGAQALHSQVVDLPPPETVVSEEFSSVAWVRVTSDGLLVVPDSRERAIYLVDIGTGSRRRVGQEGEGPGEYSVPLMALALPGDSTLVSDSRQARWLVIAPDGSIVRTVTLGGEASWVASQIPRATDARGRVYIRERDGGNVTRRPGLDMARASVIRVGPQGGSSDAVATVRTAEGDRRPVGVTLSTGGGSADTQILVMIPDPWGPQEAWGVLADGTVGIVSSDGSGVAWSDGGSTPLRLESAPVTREDRSNYYQAWLRSQVGADAAEQLASAVRPSAFDWPTRRAPFAAGHAPADPLDRLWLKLTDIDADQERYALLHRETGILMRVVLPPAARLVGFSTDLVWIAATDAVGLIGISGHPLPGTPPPDAHP